MEIQYIMVIVILVFHCIMSIVSSRVSQECTASSFRVADLIEVDVEGMDGKKMCQLHRAI